MTDYWWFEPLILTIGALALIGWVYLGITSIFDRLPWDYAYRKMRCPYCITPIRRNDKIVKGSLGWGHKRHF